MEEERRVKPIVALSDLALPRECQRSSPVFESQVGFPCVETSAWTMASPDDYFRRAARSPFSHQDHQRQNMALLDGIETSSDAS